MIRSNFDALENRILNSNDRNVFISVLDEIVYVINFFDYLSF